MNELSLNPPLRHRSSPYFFLNFFFTLFQLPLATPQPVDSLGFASSLLLSPPSLDGFYVETLIIIQSVS